ACPRAANAARSSASSAFESTVVFDTVLSDTVVFDIAALRFSRHSEAPNLPGRTRPPPHAGGRGVSQGNTTRHSCRAQVSWPESCGARFGWRCRRRHPPARRRPHSVNYEGTTMTAPEHLKGQWREWRHARVAELTRPYGWTALVAQD